VPTFLIPAKVRTYAKCHCHSFKAGVARHAIKEICLPKPLLTLKGTPNKSAFGKPEKCSKKQPYT
jgi:hypothetical protein